MANPYKRWLSRVYEEAVVQTGFLHIVFKIFDKERFCWKLKTLMGTIKTSEYRVLHNTCMARMLKGCIKELMSYCHAVLSVKHNLAGQLLAGAQMIRVETELLVLLLHGGACLL